MSYKNKSAEIGDENTPEAKSVVLTSTYQLDNPIHSEDILDQIIVQLDEWGNMTRRASSANFEYLQEGQAFDIEISLNEVGANSHPESVSQLDARKSDRLRIKIETKTSSSVIESRSIPAIASIESSLRNDLSLLWDERGTLSLTCRFKCRVVDDVIRKRDQNGYRIEAFRNNIRLGNIPPGEFDPAVRKFCSLLREQ